MNKLLVTTLLLVLFSRVGLAQDIPHADTLQPAIIHYDIYHELEREGKNGAMVHLAQPAFVKQAMQLQVAKNEGAFSMDGYRIRLYSDNKQNSRQVSEAMVNELSLKYPNLKAYRSYSSPYFRVSIGDFRTLNEARSFLDIIKIEYPKAYPVKEKISFPPL